MLLKNSLHGYFDELPFKLCVKQDFILLKIKINFDLQKWGGAHNLKTF